MSEMRFQKLKKTHFGVRRHFGKAAVLRLRRARRRALPSVGMPLRRLPRLIFLSTGFYLLSLSGKMKRASKIFIMFLSAAACVFFGGCASDSSLPPEAADASNPPRAAENREVYSYTLSQKKLLEIIDQQKRFFDRVKSESRMSQSDALSLKNKLDSLWAEYMAQYPKDIDALILYGKYLRAVGEDELSYNQFLKADALNPDIAVVKQQLANYEAEHGLPKYAFDNISAAVALDPDNSVYRLQMAALIVFFREELIHKKYFSQSQLDSLMIKSYAKAAELEPQNSNIQWKYAQAFYDVGKADWSAALAQWEKILENFAPLNLDRQTALANKARVLIELNRDKESLAVLEKVTLPSLQPDRRKLLSIIENAKKTAEPKKQNYSH